MKDFLTLALELIHIAIAHYGLTKTLSIAAIFILVAIVAWNLPEIITAWKI